MKDYSYVFNAHPEYIDAIYQKYLENPEAIEDGWRSFFEGFEFAGKNGHVAEPTISDSTHNKKEIDVASFIHGYRNRGHLLSTTNPIRQRKDRKPFLSLEDYGLSESDLSQSFASGSELGMPGATLKEIIDRLHIIYCGNIGFEYTHIQDREKRHWLRDKIESRPLNNSFGLPIEQQKRILGKLNGAVVFERFLHTKYIGQKRFSLEGGETTIPALDALINKGSAMNVHEVVIGMAHRGKT